MAEQWRKVILAQLANMRTQPRRELEKPAWMRSGLEGLGLPAWAQPPEVPPPALKAIDLRLVDDMLANSTWVSQGLVWCRALLWLCCVSLLLAKRIASWQCATRAVPIVGCCLASPCDGFRQCFRQYFRTVASVFLHFTFALPLIGSCITLTHDEATPELVQPNNTSSTYLMSIPSSYIQCR